MSNHAMLVVEPPAASALLELVARFLEEEIGPQLEDDKLRFRTRVAANLLRIARREHNAQDAFVSDVDGYQLTPDLLRLGGSLKSLGDALLKGEKDLMQPELFAAVERYVEAKVRITAPSLLD